MTLRGYKESQMISTCLVFVVLFSMNSFFIAAKFTYVLCVHKQFKVRSRYLSYLCTNLIHMMCVNITTRDPYVSDNWVFRKCIVSTPL